MANPNITKVFTNPYPDGWEDYPEETTPIDSTALQAHTNALDAIDDRIVTLLRRINPGIAQAQQINLLMEATGQDVPDPLDLYSKLLYSLATGTILSIGDYNSLAMSLIASTQLAVSANIQTSLILGTLNNIKAPINHSILFGSSNEFDQSMSSFLIGGSNHAIKDRSSGAFKDGIIVAGTYSDWSEIIGQKQAYEATPMFVIGGGTGSADRKNLLILDTDGDLKINGSIYTKDGKLTPPDPSSAGLTYLTAETYTPSGAPNPVPVASMTALISMLASQGAPTPDHIGAGVIYAIPDSYITYEIVVREELSTFATYSFSDPNLFVDDLKANEYVDVGYWRLSLLTSVRAILNKYDALEARVAALES